MPTSKIEHGKALAMGDMVVVMATSNIEQAGTAVDTISPIRVLDDKPCRVEVFLTPFASRC